MKRVLLVALLVLAVVSGCSEQADVVIDIAALDSELQRSTDFGTRLEPVGDVFIRTTLYLSLDYAEEYYVYSQAALTGESYGLFRCTTAEAAVELKAEVEEHMRNYISQYRGYAPEIVPRLENAVIRQSGRYVVFVVAENQGEALQLVDRYFPVVSR